MVLQHASPAETRLVILASDEPDTPIDRLDGVIGRHSIRRRIKVLVYMNICQLYPAYTVCAYNWCGYICLFENMTGAIVFYSGVMCALCSSMSCSILCMP